MKLQIERETSERLLTFKKTMDSTDDVLNRLMDTAEDVAAKQSRRKRSRSKK